MLSNIAKEYSDQAGELRALFEKQLKELYWAEQVMAARLPFITESCTSKDLVKVLRNHVEETKIHSLRLEKIFNVAGISAEALMYDALHCLFKELEDLIEYTKSGVVRDAGLISVLQKIKHYEIACYGTMKAHAIALREEDAVTLLETTLQEEKDIDTALSSIAESHINIEAADKEY
jgi:ferritin-like metal-binding protein YciE